MTVTTKIISYNLNRGGKTGNGNPWKRIVSEFSPDLVLAQETFDPAGYFDHPPVAKDSTVWSSLPAKWGSAVLATKNEVTPIVVPGFEGWVSGARIDCFHTEGQRPRPLAVFSIHSPSPGPYEKKVSAILDAIRKVRPAGDIVLGGDLNITTAVRHASEPLKNTTAELAILKRLRTEFGLVNAWQAVHPNEDLPQTLRWTGNKNMPYHCDGIFIPVSWLQYLSSCEVVAENWSEMSDHFPMVATFTF